MILRYIYILSQCACFLVLTNAVHAETSNPTNINSSPKYKIVIEYVENGNIAKTRVYESKEPFKSGSGISISLPDTTIILYGISACPSDIEINAYVYQGPCSQAARQYLETELSISNLVVCRAYISQAQQNYQSATCRTHAILLNTNISHNLEDLLVRTGTAYIGRNKRGELLRADLASAEYQARTKKTIIWSSEAQNAWGH